MGSSKGCPPPKARAAREGKAFGADTVVTGGGTELSKATIPEPGAAVKAQSSCCTPGLSSLHPWPEYLAACSGALCGAATSGPDLELGHGQLEDIMCFNSRSAVLFC
mmetsp:Transcript_53328/g.135296  ORF Transcript_53328/g.135296 Transcript_53328/m.135296 type:complete len:107 (+) Transcript_53328:149-469(+)